MPDISVSLAHLNWLALLYFETAYVLLPGCLLYRLLSGENRLLRLVAVGAPIGHAVCIAAFLASKIMGTAPLFLYYPLAFLAAGAAAWVRSGDGPVLTLDAGRLELAALLGLFSALGVLIYVDAYLQYQLPSEHPALFLYESDLAIFLALAAEIKNHWPLQMPFIAGEPVNYHYFAYARMAAMSVATGVPLEQVVYRLAIVPTLWLAALQLYVLGRLFGKTALAGICGAALVLLVRDVFPFAQSRLMGGAHFANIVASPCYLYGSVFFGALLIEFSGALDGNPAPAAFWKRAAAFCLLIFGMTGGKATAVPPILAGVGWIGLHAWRKGSRPLAWSSFRLAAAGGAVFLTMAVLLFRNHQPVQFDPLHVVKNDLFSSLGAIPGAVVMLFLWLFAYLLGTKLFLAKSGELDLKSRYLLAVAATSGLAGLSIGHFGYSEFYFIFGAMTALSPFAGQALADALVGRDRSKPALALVAACALGLVSTCRQCADSVGAYRRRDRELSAKKNAYYNPLIYEGLVWLRDHTPVDSVVVGNIVTKSCVHYSAIGERRQVLEMVRFSPKWQTYDLAHPNEVLDLGPYEERWRRVKLIFYGANQAALEDAVKQFKATHLVVQRFAQAPPLALPPNLELLFHNALIAIYKIRA